MFRGSQSHRTCFPHVPFAAAMSLALFAALGATSVFAADGAAKSPPDFSSTQYGWASRGAPWSAMPGSPPPVGQDPNVPYVANNTDQQPTFRYADADNSNLTPWAKERLKADNVLQDRGFYMFTRQSRCWPSGASAFHFDPGQPTFFVQTPKEVLMIWAGDHQVRHIYLDVPHSRNPKPSWYGESVGHYEGDTLVVDTIGEIPRTFLDQYRTPHGPKLHLIERMRVVDGGKAIETEMTIEDPDALLKPLHVVHRAEKVQGPMAEASCAEDGGDHFPLWAEPIPVAETPDF